MTDANVLSSGVLSGVVAQVVSLGSGCVDSQKALEAKLQKLGAIVKSRYSKQVTHVVFHRQLQPSDDHKRDEDDVLRNLLSQASRVMFPY